MRVDDVIIGGGFYGATLAVSLRRAGRRVVLLERDDMLLARASERNQARVHNGYHYPRSVLTALRSRVNYPGFLTRYAPAIVDTEEMIYAVAKAQSKVTGAQFRVFCERIGASIRPADRSTRDLFDPELIDAVYAVEESVFDAAVLRRLVSEDIESEGVDVRFRADASKVTEAAAGGLELTYRDPTGEHVAATERVFNCTYSRINRILVDSGLSCVPLKHELTELALCRPPAEFAHRGVTVMCGPFFSLMPFPSRALHTLSHVRYTPHAWWKDEPGREYVDPYRRLESFEKRSAFVHMQRDAARYLPCLRTAEYEDSLWEVKTVLPRSEGDDSRPILMHESERMPGLISVMGSKIDNVKDLVTSVVDDEAEAP